MSMKLPPLPASVPFSELVKELKFFGVNAYTDIQMREYATAAYREALEQAAQLVELEYAKDHQGVLRLKQIAGHIRDLSK